jgi:hypothetical protein
VFPHERRREGAVDKNIDPPLANLHDHLIQRADNLHPARADPNLVEVCSDVVCEGSEHLELPYRVE